LPGQPHILARFENLIHQNRRTAIGTEQACVEMTEHVLAPFVARQITSAVIEIDGDETPAGDGSSLLFWDAIESAGVATLSSPIEPAIIREPIRIEDGAASIEIVPSDLPGLSVEYELDYEHPGIGHQVYSARIDEETFGREIAPARTFVLEQEVAYLRQMGIGTRQTARDLLVFAADGSIIDNDLRFQNECARHKLLDVVGDLALLGRPIWGSVRASRTGHRHNVALVRQIDQQMSHGRASRQRGPEAA
jgi:UDP-3-O-acyl-N-acetylglucosamine deacetylase